MASLELRFFGGFDVRRDGVPIKGFDTDKTRALLAYLAVENGHTHRRDSLACLLWPERPETAARRSLRQALWRLRHALDGRGEPLLHSTRQDIRFDAATDCRLDVARFTGLLARCRAHEAGHREPCAACAGWRREAVALYRGDFLAGLTLRGSEAFDGWLVAHQETYHRLAMDALARLAAFHEARGEYAEAEVFARRCVEMEPWAEAAHRDLMRILALAGQRGAAIHQHAVCREILAAELGVAPSGETMSLYREICEGTGDLGLGIGD